ncbi:MAG: PKD domain-containing protein, partial [Bacteroidota bacterium]
GTALSSIGGGVGGAFPEVRAIALEPGGDLVATGGFETAFDTPGGSGTTVNYVARWDASGGTWQPLGPGFDFFPNVRDIESDGTTVVASGAFLQVGGVGSAVYRWDGAAWAPWQGVVPGTFMRDLTMDGQGTLYLVPDVFFPSAVYARQVGDPAWTLIGTENLELFEMVAANARRPVADAYLGGVYFQIDVPGGAPVLAQNHARWDGVRWRPLATGSTGNTPPVITSLFGPTLGDEGSQFAYNANGFDLDGDPLTYTWDFGDGSPVVSELERDTLTHIYADDGVYTLTVTVSDGGPVDAVATQIVTVDNVDPTIASLTGDLMGVEGNTFAYTAAATDPAGANDPLTYTWDFGDGTAPASGVDLTGVSHVYATDGAYTLSLTVTDGDGGSASGSLSVTVTDAPVGLPNVTIAVTTTTTTVPAGGGLLAYTIRVTNNEPTPQTADLWLLATTPTGNEVRVRRPRSVTLPPLRSVAASFTKQVPGIAPAGTYVVTGRLGEMASGVIYSADTFTFDKAASRPLAGASETFDAEVEAALVEILELDDDIAFEEIGDAAHPSVALVGARPNPFADRLSVDIALVEATKARLALYDARGREVAVVAEARLDAGRHTLALDARGLPSGVYLLRLQTGEAVTSRRVTLVR